MLCYLQPQNWYSSSTIDLTIINAAPGLSYPPITMNQNFNQMEVIYPYYRHLNGVNNFFFLIVFIQFSDTQYIYNLTTTMVLHCGKRLINKLTHSISLSIYLHIFQDRLPVYSLK